MTQTTEPSATVARMGLRFSGFERDGAREALARGFGVARVEQHRSQIVMGFVERRPQRGGAPEMVRRSGVVAALLGEIAEL